MLQFMKMTVAEDLITPRCESDRALDESHFIKAPLQSGRSNTQMDRVIKADPYY